VMRSSGHSRSTTQWPERSTDARMATQYSLVLAAIHTCDTV
jgi:hypothetical protein